MARLRTFNASTMGFLSTESKGIVQIGLSTLHYGTPAGFNLLDGTSFRIVRICPVETVESVPVLCRLNVRTGTARPEDAVLRASAMHPCWCCKCMQWGGGEEWTSWPAGIKRRYIRRDSQQDYTLGLSYTASALFSDMPRLLNQQNRKTI